MDLILVLMMTKIIFSDFDYTLLNYYSDKNYFDDYQIGVLSRLKEKGIKLQQEVIKTFDLVENKLLEGFSKNEKEQLFNFLGRIRKNLEGKD